MQISSSEFKNIKLVVLNSRNRNSLDAYYYQDSDSDKKSIKSPSDVSES